MSIYRLNEITTMQFIFLVSGTAVSFGFIEVPGTLFHYAGTDGWITLILGSAITIAASLAAVAVMRTSPDGALPELIAGLAGKAAGKIAAVAIGAYFILFAYDGLIYATRVVKDRLLPETPAYLILTLILIPSYLASRGGLRIVGRYAELAVLSSFWIPLVFLLVFKQAHWLYLLPVLKDGWAPVLSGVPHTFFYFLGFFSTMLVYPQLQRKDKAVFALVVSGGITLFAYLFIAIVSFVFFSPNEILGINQPTLYMLKTVELSFIEQVEGLFLVMYLLLFSLAWVPALYFAASCASWTIGKRDHRPSLRVIIALTAISSYLYVPTFRESFALNDTLGRIGIGVEYVFPALLLLLLWIAGRARGAPRPHETAND